MVQKVGLELLRTQHWKRSYNESGAENSTSHRIFEQMKHRHVAIATLILSGAILFLAREPILSAFGDFLVVRDDLHPADVIHVIAGADYRTDYAIQLYRQGYGKQVFFTGGWCTFHNLYHGQHGRNLALGQGVPPESIAIDDTHVTSTYSEAVRLKEYIAKSPVPVKSVIVVSDPFHMRRARLTYKWVLGDEVNVQMAPIPFDLTPYQHYWWTDEASRQYVLNEYVKLVYYYARYRLSGGPLKDWLASLDRE
jgi:uncharacterized SAM-binding protein YcdF (DUF218 family)